MRGAKLRPHLGLGPYTQSRVMVHFCVFIIFFLSAAYVVRVLCLEWIAGNETIREYKRATSSAACMPGLSLSSSSSYEDLLDTTFDLHGYVLSNVKERFDSAASILAKFNITAHQYEPPSYKSKMVHDAMEKFHNSTDLHSDQRNLKIYSQRMAHLGMLLEFVADQSTKINSWRFFFEDDIGFHPNVTAEMATDILSKGLEVGSADGLLYLGICGPAEPSEYVYLGYGASAEKTYGLCTHAYGVTKWRAAAILAHLEKVEISRRVSENPQKGKMFYDLMLKNYCVSVTRAWVLGSNFRSPVPWEIDHWGLIYQDRLKYPSTLGPKNATEQAAN